MLARQRQPQRPHSGGDDDARAAKVGAPLLRRAAPALKLSPRAERAPPVTPSGAPQRAVEGPPKSLLSSAVGARTVLPATSVPPPGGRDCGGPSTARCGATLGMTRGPRYARDDGFVSSACGQFQRRSGSPQERRSILWRRERHSGPTEDNIRPTEFHANHIEPRSPRTPLSPRAERRSAQSRGSHHGCPWR